MRITDKRRRVERLEAKIGARHGRPRCIVSMDPIGYEPTPEELEARHSRRPMTVEEWAAKFVTPD